ncbi:hypothetical protein VTI74DRAFT_7732 [Chaetomium olivicolor]
MPAAARQANLLPPPPPGPVGNRQISNLAKSGNIFHQKPPARSRFNPHPRNNIPQGQTILPPPPPPAQPALTLPQQQLQPPHYSQPYHQPADNPPADPRETIPLLEALGPSRTIIQYVVYRTPRFHPPSSFSSSSSSSPPTADDPLSQAKLAKAVRCTEHLSLPHANSAAAARLERVRKGVVSKAWRMTTNSTLPSASPSSGGGVGNSGNLLYEGRVGYDNGDMQCFWVAEEAKDLESVGVVGGGDGDVTRTGGCVGFENVRVDKQGVGVWRRKRFDVWSRVYWSRVVRERKGSRGQRAVVDCREEGDGSEDGEGEELGNGEDRREEKGGEKETNGNKEEGAGNDDLFGKGEAAQAVARKEIGGNSRNDQEGGNEEPPEKTQGEDSKGDKERHVFGHETEVSYPKPTAEKPAQNDEPQAKKLGERGPTKGKMEDTDTDDSEADEDKDEEDDGEQNTKRIDEFDHPSSPFAPSIIRLPPNTTPLDLFDTAVKLHGTYTTLSQANRAALATFLELAKPNNSALDDNHYYTYQVKPEAIERFEEAGCGNSDCTAPAQIEWDLPKEKRYRWEFLRLVVEVVESELTGPVDVSDMVVEGGDLQVVTGRSGQGKGAGKVVNGSRVGVSKEAEVETGSAARLLSPLEEESGGEVSEEE